MLAIGTASSFISFIYITVVLTQKLLGYAIPGWAALMSAILFLGGMNLMMLGFIGLYIGSLFRESKKRPKYIIKNIQKNHWKELHEI
jgi:dolichol-phosphate mannosyltransferase